MKPSDLVVDLAARIADGTGVAWPSAGSRDSNAENLAVIEELKAIAAIASLHRAPLDDEAAASGSDSSVWNGLTVVEKIAEGRFGEVYRAWDARLQRHVALKLLHAPASSSYESPTRAIDEARLLARVRHPNVLTVHGAECVESRIGIWTEFVEGRTLEAWLAERGPLDANEVAAIGADVCGALAAVHGAGLLHRDVKAANVMREVGGRIVLMDFGTAHDPSAVPSSVAGTAGTPLYMAPELFDGGKPTVASDIYAVAVLLFRLLSDEYPITGHTVADVKGGHAADRRRRLLDISADIPVTLAAAVERGLSVDPVARHASAEDFAGALTIPRGPSQLDVADPSRSVFGRHRAWFATGAVVAIGAGALGLWRSSHLSIGVGSADVPTLVCRDCADTTASLSRDGRYAVVLHRDSGDLATRELATSNTQRLVAKSGTWVDSPNYAELPVLSRDASQVAFRWVIRGTGRSELRVMLARPGAQSAALLASTDLRTTKPYRQSAAVSASVTPHDWRPNGSAVLATLTLPDEVQLAWVDALDGHVTVLRSLGSHRFDPVIAARVSPDGQRIVYSARAQTIDDTLRPARAAAGTHLFLINSDGTEHTRLVGTAAANGRPVWAPGGAHVLFTSDVGGSFDLWAIPIGQSPSVRSPVLLKKNIGQIEAMGITPEGRYYYAEQMQPLDLITLSPVDTPVNDLPASSGRAGSLVGINPQWSPDGRSMAFMRKQLPAGDRAVVVRDLETQHERVYPFPGLRAGPPMWTEEGRAILIDANRGDGTWSLYRVDLSTGTFDEVVPGRSNTVVRSAAAALAPDFRTVYFGARDASDTSGAWDRIVAVDLATGYERVVLQLPGDRATWPRGGHLGLAVSPDGRTLALDIVDPGARRARVLLVGVDGRNLRALVAPFAVNGAFGKIAWTRDDSIWFAAAMTDGTGRQGWRIMRVAATGGIPEAVSSFINGMDDGASFDPSPDGSRVAWYPSPGFSESSGDQAGPQSVLWMLDLSGLLSAQR